MSLKENTTKVYLHVHVKDEKSDVLKKDSLMHIVAASEGGGSWKPTRDD